MNKDSQTLLAIRVAGRALVGLGVGLLFGAVIGTVCGLWFIPPGGVEGATAGALWGAASGILAGTISASDICSKPGGDKNQTHLISAGLGIVGGIALAYGVGHIGLIATWLIPMFSAGASKFFADSIPGWAARAPAP